MSLDKILMSGFFRVSVAHLSQDQDYTTTRKHHGDRQTIERSTIRFVN